jgi:hypothetical protein
MKTFYISGITTAIATVVVLITTILVNAAYAYDDPEHCDKSGWPSCYTIGYQDGQSDAQNGMSIDWGAYNSHSSEWRHGYDDGLNIVKQNIDQSQFNTQSSNVNIRGDNNRVTVEQGQSTGDGGSSDGGHHNGGFLPQCKVLCIGIK